MSEQAFKQWQIDLGGPVALLEWFGSGDGVPLLLVHGADGSAANWIDLAPLLSNTRRVVALDLPGFGRSPVAGRKASMAAYAELVCELIERELGGRAVIVGNSMGAVVSVLAAARAGESVAATSLVAPALPRKGSLPIDPTMLPMLAPFLVPGLMGMEARRRHGLPPERRVRDLLTMCYASGNRESEDAFSEMVDVARNRERSDQVQGWSKAFRSLLWWLVRRRAWDRKASMITGPVQIIEGALDPIIPARSIEGTLERHSGWSRQTLEGVGHVPQLEAPERMAEALERLISKVD